MIWHPKVGQRVALHFRRTVYRHMAYEGRCGTVMRGAGGRGPRNVEVLLEPPEAGIRVVVPRGNLVAADAECPRHHRPTPCCQCAISQGLRFWWAAKKKEERP